jgi:hypothetical protein
MAAQDEMVNNWGCNLVWAHNKNSCHKTFNQFDLLIRGSVKGFKLERLTASGTEANGYAIDKATNSSITCLLVGMGSYVGGLDPLQGLSSSTFAANKTLSIPKDPAASSIECIRQTVALPYYVQKTSIDATELAEYENRCLESIRKKLLVATLSGNPYKALLLEYVLGGNGGELSHQFLGRLGRLLKNYKCIVIADEILTTGRVGPQMTMTTSMPIDLLEMVEFITVGKVTDCGLVLKKVPTKPQTHDEHVRGTSTHMDAGCAYSLWSEVYDRVIHGALNDRKQAIVKKMKLENCDLDHWGCGLLMYTSKTRPTVQKGLKNRLLPMAETKAKIVVLSTTKSNWNADTVSAMLIEKGEKWIKVMDEGSHQHLPFVSKMVELIDASLTDIIQFTDRELESFIGDNQASSLATSECERIKGLSNPYSSSQRCNRKALTFIRQATMCASQLSPIDPTTGIRAICKKRIGHKRIETNIVDRRFLGYDAISSSSITPLLLL